MTSSNLNFQWPVPESFSQTLPVLGAPGSFWEHRGDRFHCGIDLYAPFGCDVCAIDSGVVVEIELFTSPARVPYWNETVAITVKHDCGFYVRYAELLDTHRDVGERVRGGEKLGRVGKVLEPSRITEQAPLYIQKLKEKNNPCMLHVELFDRFPLYIPQYLGGNTFQNKQPIGLLNPLDYFSP